MKVAQSMEMEARDVKEVLKPSSSKETSRGLPGILKVNQSPGIKASHQSIVTGVANLATGPPSVRTSRQNAISGTR